MTKIKTEDLLSHTIKYWPCFLIILAFFGFISKSLYNYPISIMAILGFYKIISVPGILKTDAILKTFAFVFLCLWLPLLISFPDAVNHKHSAHTIFPYLRFFFAGIFIIIELSKDADRIKYIITAVFFLVLFWCLDATIQFVFHKNLLGFPYESEHITGMFYPRNTISHICSILSAFLFLYVYSKIESNKYLAISIIPLFFIILLSGRRAAWVMLALSSFGFLIYGLFYSLNKTYFLKITGVISIFIAILFALTITYHSSANKRFKTTLGLFSVNYDVINHATAFRLPIWETSYKIFKANPINGIGPRGFRYAYKDYASENDMYGKDIPTQPHIIIMEILAETGLIGFLAYLFAFYLIISLLKKNKKTLIPYFIPIFVAMFPFNTHMAFYGSIWSSMTWLLISLFFAKVKLNNYENKL